MCVDCTIVDTTLTNFRHGTELRVVSGRLALNRISVILTPVSYADLVRLPNMMYIDRGPCRKTNNHG